MARFWRTIFRQRMKFKMTIFLIILLLGFGTAKKPKLTNPQKVPKKAILLSKVESLTFYSGRSTTGRRSSPVPQLTCTGPAEVCALHVVDVMRCTNEGADYDAENIQWACKASLPEEFKLGSTEVICEGYESAEDPYVLRGSCGVEYRLLLTDKGEERYGGKGKSRSSWSNGPTIDVDYNPNTSEKGITSVVFLLVFAGVLFIIVRGFWRSLRQDNPARRIPGPRRYGGGGGTGGNDDDDDGGSEDPPPYDSHGFNSGAPPRKFRTQQQSSGDSSTTAESSRTANQGQQDGPWRPGFWTGAAAGGAAAYLANQRNQRSQQRQEETRAGGLFGRSFNTAPSRSSGSGSSSYSNFTTNTTSSSPRHESTGFGGTRRR